MVIDKDVAEVVKNFLENYAEVHGLPSPGRSVNRITQSIVSLPAEMSYKSVYRDFLAGLEEDNKLKSLKPYRKFFPENVWKMYSVRKTCITSSFLCMLNSKNKVSKPSLAG